jgi:hypothetical protein
MLSVSISYRDLLNCLYFADTTKRGTTNIQFVVFYFMGKQYQLHKKWPLIGVFTQATHDEATHDDWTTTFEDKEN